MKATDTHPEGPAPSDMRLILVNERPYDVSTRITGAEILALVKVETVDQVWMESPDPHGRDTEVALTERIVVADGMRFHTVPAWT